MKQMKKIVAGISFLMLAVTPALAFEVNDPLTEQIDVMQNAMINNDDSLTLESSSNTVEAIRLSPAYADDETMYVTTDSGVYVNGEIVANFGQNDSWPEDMKDMPLQAQFNSNYSDNGVVALTSGATVYLSYDKGNTWGKVDVAAEGETVSKVFIGPNFSQHQLLYFITPTGLYAQDLSGPPSKTLVLASDSEGSITDFSFSPASTKDTHFYVVKGTKVLKTENLGSSWLEYDAGQTIKQFLIADDGSISGDALILTGTKNFMKAEGDVDFGPMNLPADVNAVYAMTYVLNGDQDYVINTDKGFYMTFDNGSSWGLIEEDVSDYSKVTELAAVIENGKTTIYYVVDGQLYKDDEANGVSELFMTGINTNSKYAMEGSAESKDMVELTGHSFNSDYKIIAATLWPDGDLNSQTMDFYMSTDGTNWEPVTLEEEHVFEHQGTMLQWKVEMKTADSAVSPVLRTVLVDFGLEEVPAGSANTCAGFTDVPNDSPNCAALTYVKNQGIFTGYPDGTFKPDQVINRAETVKVITEGFDLNMLPDPSDKLGFSDVVLHEWYMPYLATAKSEGVIQGYPDGTFKPEQTVNYVELIKVFFETADVTLPATSSSDAWYQKYLTYAKDNNYLTYTDLTAGMKRSDVAKLFYQLSQK